MGKASDEDGPGFVARIYGGNRDSGYVGSFATELTQY